MKKIVIFDWGGVIESHENFDAVFNEAIISTIKYFNKEIDSSKILEKWNICWNSDKSLGEISDVNIWHEWFDRVNLALKLNCTFDEFCKVYNEVFSKIKYYQDIVSLAHSLKDKCLIGIFSNLSFLDKPRLDSQVDLKRFDYVFLSYELECLKPNEYGYIEIEKTLNIDPSNILFIDDMKENVQMARKRGWNTCNAFGYEYDKIKNSIDDFLSK